MAIIHIQARLNSARFSSAGQSYFPASESRLQEPLRKPKPALSEGPFAGSRRRRRRHRFFFSGRLWRACSDRIVTPAGFRYQPRNWRRMLWSNLQQTRLSGANCVTQRERLRQLWAAFCDTVPPANCRSARVRGANATLRVSRIRAFPRRFCRARPLTESDSDAAAAALLSTADCGSRSGGQSLRQIWASVRGGDVCA